MRQWRLGQRQKPLEIKVFTLLANRYCRSILDRFRQVGLFEGWVIDLSSRISCVSHPIEPRGFYFRECYSTTLHP
jgi:hypothetical protein